MAEAAAGGTAVGADRKPFRFTGPPTRPLVATAIHAGHDLRPEVERLLCLDEPARLREEDPFTDRIGGGIGAQVVVHRSRFEVDLNRSRDAAVYRRPDDCWGLDLWRGALPDDVVERSLAMYDAFYEELAGWLDPLADAGAFVVLDVHSYNHRREGPDGPEAPAIDNPVVNVGTGSMDRARWAPVVDGFMDALGRHEVGGRPLDVRENVRFQGANLARWVHERYPDTGCALALEFKKTFMDEWTGIVDDARLRKLAAALEGAAPAAIAALEVCG